MTRQEQYEEMVADQAREIADLRNVVRIHLDDHDEPVNALRDREQNRFANLSAEITKLRGRVAGIENQIDTLREDIEHDRFSGCDVAPRLEALEKRMDAVDDTGKGWNAEFTEPAREIADLRGRVGREQNRFANLSAEVIELRERVENLDRWHEATEEKLLAPMRHRLDALEKQGIGVRDHMNAAVANNKCETCRYGKVLSKNQVWCGRAGDWAEMAYNVCEWEPKAEQPKEAGVTLVGNVVVLKTRVAEAKALLERCYKGEQAGETGLLDDIAACLARWEART